MSQSALDLLRKQRRKRRRNRHPHSGTTIPDDGACSRMSSGAGTGEEMAPQPPLLYLLMPPTPSLLTAAAADSTAVSSSHAHAHNSNAEANTNRDSTMKKEASNSLYHLPSAATSSSNPSLAGPYGGVFEIGPGITEVAGEAGAGKTQLCLRLCVSCALMSYHCEGGSSAKQVPVGEHQIQYPRMAQFQPMAQPMHQLMGQNPSSYPHHQSYLPQAQCPSGMQHPAQPQYQPQYQQKLQTKRKYHRALYVTMGEGLSPGQIAARLRQMASASVSAATATSTGTNATCHNGAGRILSRILTRTVRNEDDFLDLVHRELPDLLRQSAKSQSADTTSTSIGRNESRKGEEEEEDGRIGLVVLDSLAGLFRVPDENEGKQQHQHQHQQNYQRDHQQHQHQHQNQQQGHPMAKKQRQQQQKWQPNFYIRRSELLFGVSARLRALADTYGVAFVVTNQVSAGGFGSESSIVSMRSSRSVPALGLSWSNCVNTRFLLRRRETLSSQLSTGPRNGIGSSNAGGRQQQQAPPVMPLTSKFRRWATVAKSSILPPVEVPFDIEMVGGVATELPNSV